MTTKYPEIPFPEGRNHGLKCIKRSPTERNTALRKSGKRWHKLPPELHEKADQLYAALLKKHAHKLHKPGIKGLLAGTVTSMLLHGTRDWGKNARARKGNRMRQLWALGVIQRGKPKKKFVAQSVQLPLD